jgi:hypothetical protein
VPALAANPDAELLALGAELEHVEQELMACLTISEKLGAVREAACKLAGVPLMTYDETKPRAYWEAYVEKRNSVQYEGKEAEKSHEAELTDIDHQKYEIINKIVWFTPKTVAGATVVVRAMVLDNSEWWEQIYDNGLETMPEGRGRLFLESLCSFFGIVPQPRFERAMMDARQLRT